MGTRKSGSTGRHRTEPDPAARAVGSRIKALRVARGVSFDELVAVSGLGRGYVSELERGLVVPGLQALSQIARALSVTVADLVLGKTPREQLFELTRDLPDTKIRELLAGLRAASRLG